MKKIVTLLTITLLSGCAYIGHIESTSANISNFHKVSKTIYRGGKPTKAGLEELQALGIKTIINLEKSNQSLVQEKIKIRKLGMYFYSLPISLYERPNDKTILKFLDIILLRTNQPVFIYCENGKDKTGTMVAVYRTVVQGWGPKEAYEEAKKFGFWPYRGENALKNFIHQLKDKKIYFEKARNFGLQKDCNYGN